MRLAGVPVAEGAGRRRAPDVVLGDRLVPRAGPQRLDDLTRADSDRRSIGPDRGDVGARRQLAHLAVGHAGPDDTPRHVHAARPLGVENLIRAGDDQVDRDVLSARHVPEEPHERVQSLAGPQTHLVVAELVEDHLRRERASAHLARVNRGVLAQEEGEEIHRDYTRANALTGNVPKRFTFTGTAKKRLPRSGRASSPRRCSTTGISCPSRTECTGRSRVAMPSMFSESMPTRTAPARTSRSASSPVRCGCPSKYRSLSQCRSQPVCTRTARPRTSASVSPSRSMTPAWPAGTRATTQSRFASDSSGSAARSFPWE